MFKSFFPSFMHKKALKVAKEQERQNKLKSVNK